MKHECTNCKYIFIPSSMKEYYEKTLTIPDNPRDFYKDIKKHFFYLCSNPLVAKTDHTNNSLIMTPCRNKNFNGECHYYREENAEDILPSTIKIKADKTEFEYEEEGSIEVEITPYTEPAVTEEVQKTDIDGELMFDEEGNPVMETIEIKPEFMNDQQIDYSYQWYIDGRKLWKEKEAILNIDSTNPGTYRLKCNVIQNLKDNGDGGNKVYNSFTEEVLITVKEEPEEEPSDEEISD